MDVHSIAEARSQLPRLIQDAEQGLAVAISRRGEPVAVLLSYREYQDYLELSKSRAAWWPRLQALRKNLGVSAGGWDPQEVDAWRERAPS